MNHSVNSNHANYITRGSGAPVVLIHGIAASLHDWVYLMPELARNGYRAYALDLLGHGESAKPDSPEQYNIEAMYAHFQEWLEGLGLQDFPLLVGHSLGGYLSLLYALRCPQRVRALVLIDPFYTPDQLSFLLRWLSLRPEWGEKAIRTFPEWLIRRVISLDPGTAENFSKSMRRQIAEDYKRASPNVVYFTRSIPDITPQLSRVNAPALVLWGEKDLTLKPTSFRRLTRTLPNAASHSLPSSGHQPHLAQPHIVNRLVLNYLTRLADSSAVQQAEGK